MKKLLSIALVLVLALIFLMPAPALAARPEYTDFNAQATISAITTGDMVQLGKTGTWLVRNREIQGAIGGSINGDFTLTYRGIFELVTQAGAFNGNFESGSYQMRVVGASTPLDVIDMGGGVFLPKLNISGLWDFKCGAHGGGQFSGWAIFIPDAQGHVVQIIASQMVITGKWRAD